MRMLPSVLALAALFVTGAPALAEDAAAPAPEIPAEAPAVAETQPDMMDWYQEERRATVQRSLKDAQKYRDRWPAHVKERYNIEVQNADNSFTPYVEDATGGEQPPAPAAFTPAGVPPKMLDEPPKPVEGAEAAPPEEEKKPKTGWPSETKEN